MPTDSTVPVDAQHAEVMASVDSSPSGSRLVIADISRDEAWLSVGTRDAPELPEWR